MTEEIRKADGVRKKGRPRNPKNQPAIERRREQLRTAQQSYRARKDVTIDKLQKRVKNLEGSIEQLSESFLYFTSLLLETRLLDQNSHVTSALQNITQQYLALAEIGCTSSDEKVVDKAVPNKEKRRSPRGASTASSKSASTELSATSRDSNEISFRSMTPLVRTTPPPSFNITSSAIEVPNTRSPSLAEAQILFPTVALKKNQWDFSQYLVKVCCENGYQLLVNSPNNAVKIQEVFGQVLPPAERENFISCFHAGIHDKSGRLVDLMATILAPMHSKRVNSPWEETTFYTEAMNPETSEFLDARGVQRLLTESGFGTKAPLSRSGLGSSPHVVALVQYLAAECICFGHGPAFRRQVVEAALRLIRKS